MENFVGKIGGFMNYVVAKRDVASNNISNANTPGYKAKDVSFLEQLEGSGAGSSGSLQMRPVNNDTALFQTQTNHLPITNMSGTNQSFQIKTKPGSVKQDGNGVDVTTEMIEMMKVNQLYATAVHALGTQSNINSAARGK